MKIIRGKIQSAKKVVIYGPEGIGKSTLASQFPDPIFIDTEGSTKDMDVARTEPPGSWPMLMEQVRYFIGHPGGLRTLVIDTADWAEQLCTSDVCARYQKTGIEDFGYGKGYVFLQEEFGRLLNLLTELVEGKGIHVALAAHARMRKFEQPDELGAYDRWEMKLSRQVAPMVKEWADMVLFANYKTFVINVDGQGAQKGKNKVQGGKRVMYTTHHSCWDAKNRYGLPDEVPFEYGSIRHILEGQGAAMGNPAPSQEGQAAAGAGLAEAGATGSPPASNAPAQKAGSKGGATPNGGAATAAGTGGQAADARPASPAQPMDARQEPAGQAGAAGSQPDPRIPKKLRDLMAANSVCEWDIENVCEAKGYVPAGTPLHQYEEVSPGFIDGVLVGAWPQVFAAIKEMKENDAVVFN